MIKKIRGHLFNRPYNKVNSRITVAHEISKKKGHPFPSNMTNTLLLCIIVQCTLNSAVVVAVYSNISGVSSPENGQICLDAFSLWANDWLNTQKFSLHPTESRSGCIRPPKSWSRSNIQQSGYAD